MLTQFEMSYLLVQPFLPYHVMRVRRDLNILVKPYAMPVNLLDVGARKSHYTIAVDAAVTMLDLRREAPLQNKLNLGVTDVVLEQIQKRRSNVRDYWVQDFLTADLPDGYFDVVTAIEVIEHIPEDTRFVKKAFQVLKSPGVLYVTTPNGKAIPNKNPDHVRHYKAEELEALLLSFFHRVTVKHGEVMTKCWKKGLHPWKRDPGALIANLFNHVENRIVEANPYNSARLFATAWKV